MTELDFVFGTLKSKFKILQDFIPNYDNPYPISDIRYLTFFVIFLYNEMTSNQTVKLCIYT